jgi:hypothetical protein
MFFACGMHQRRLLVLVVTALAALLVSGCGGGDGASQEDDSAEDATTMPFRVLRSSALGRPRFCRGGSKPSRRCHCSSVRSVVLMKDSIRKH